MSFYEASLSWLLSRSRGPVTLKGGEAKGIRKPEEATQELRIHLAVCGQVTSELCQESGTRQLWMGEGLDVLSSWCNLFLKASLPGQPVAKETQYFAVQGWRENASSKMTGKCCHMSRPMHSVPGAVFQEAASLPFPPRNLQMVRTTLPK